MLLQWPCLKTPPHMHLFPSTPHLQPPPVHPQESFRLGVFTSATERTTSAALDMLETAAGEGPPIFGDRRLVLHRAHTAPAGKRHVAAGGNPWDTVKPLHCHFRNIHRVILVDDDAYKVCGGQGMRGMRAERPAYCSSTDSPSSETCGTAP
jgi:hypothetical protein